jgi:hypothetical protein
MMTTYRYGYTLEYVTAANGTLRRNTVYGEFVDVDVDEPKIDVEVFDVAMSQLSLGIDIEVVDFDFQATEVVDVIVRRGDNDMFVVTVNNVNVDGSPSRATAIEKASSISHALVAAGVDARVSDRTQ